VYTESLTAVKSSYETITSIHIYSLSAYRLQDLRTLSDVGRHLYNTYFVKEDPLEHNATYGVIGNKNVRRRTRRGPPPPSVASKPTIKAETTSKRASNPIEKVNTTPQLPVKKEETSRPSSAGSTTTTSTTTKQPSLKRDTSDIFKAFAKSKNAAAKPTPNLSRNGTESSIGNSADKDSNLPNTTDDEGESEEEALFLDTKTRAPSKKRASTGKAERAAKLRKMMDDSDEEMEDAQLIDPEQAGYGKGDQPKKDGKSQKAAAMLKQGTGQEDTSPNLARLRSHT
jgi:DNA polymerase delta subunit 3